MRFDELLERRRRPVLVSRNVGKRLAADLVGAALRARDDPRAGRSRCPPAGRAAGESAAVSVQLQTDLPRVLAGSRGAARTRGSPRRRTRQLPRALARRARPPTRRSVREAPMPTPRATQLRQHGDEASGRVRDARRRCSPRRIPRRRRRPRRGTPRSRSPTAFHACDVLRSSRRAAARPRCRSRAIARSSAADEQMRTVTVTLHRG